MIVLLNGEKQWQVILIINQNLVIIPCLEIGENKQKLMEKFVFTALPIQLTFRTLKFPETFFCQLFQIAKVLLY